MTAPNGLSAKTSTAASTSRARVLSRLRRGTGAVATVVIAGPSRGWPRRRDEVTARLSVHCLYSIHYAYSNMSSYLFRLGRRRWHAAPGRGAAWVLLLVAVGALAGLPVVS